MLLSTRIICVILGLCTIGLPISTHAYVQYVPLGNKVTIPCDGFGDRRTAKWLHKTDDNEFITIVHKTLGFTFQNKPLLTRKKTFGNFSLEISPFTEWDKGTYVCEVCTPKERCTGGQRITLLPKFDTFSVALRTQLIIEGDQFSYSCLYNLTLNADWRFEACGENTATPVNRDLTNKNLLFIPDVQLTNAGKYSYWGQTSTGQRQKMCSVTLCVLSVGAVKLTDSPQNCTLYCDVDIDADEGGLAVVGTDKWDISNIGRVNKPKSSVSCRMLSSIVESHTFSLENATATAQSHAVSFTAAGNMTSSYLLRTALISMSAALLFIIIIALFIILYVLKQRSDRNSSTSANGHSEESQVIYSSLQVGTYQQQNVITSDTECVYSQIKV